MSAETEARERLKRARRVVVKVGSQVLADEPAAFGRIGYDIAHLVPPQSAPCPKSMPALRSPAPSQKPATAPA